MSFRKPWLIVCVALSTAALSGAQSPDDEEETGGFWPTKLMLSRALDRMVEDMSGHYEFDEAQAAHVSDVVKQRLPEWMNKNRKEITTLMNQYIEAILDGEPPDPETVAEWSKRVQPLMSEFQDLVEGMSGEFSEVMNDDQRVQLEGELAAFNTGFSFVQKKIAVWADGGYDPEAEWPRNNDKFAEDKRKERGEIRDAMKDARSQATSEARVAYGLEGSPEQQAAANAEAQAAAAAAAAEKAAVEAANASEKPTGPTKPARAKGPRDEWEVYVEAFIRKYELKEDQTAKAQQYLKSAQDERDNWLRKKGDEFARIDKRIRDAKSKEDREKAQAELDKARAPIDRIFRRMENKLFDLPTSKQKLKVRDAETKAASAAKPANADGSGAKQELMVEPADGGKRD
ncbi:MAG: hypothetical protein JNG88_00815 [Phycisphaerales bacterium]|nr:hypothetical protein [Phycisphaerales bacterium]